MTGKLDKVGHRLPGVEAHVCLTVPEAGTLGLQTDKRC